MNPRFTAMLTAWVLSSACSLARMFLIRVLTVCSETFSSSPMTRFFFPAAIRRNTLTSRALNSSVPPGVARERGQHDKPGIAIFAAQGSDDAQAVDLGHLQVDQRYIRAMLAELRQ